MSKCYQCDRQAMYDVGNVPLCLQCAATAEHISNMQWLKNAAGINQALDEMDTVTGIALGGGRMPVAAVAAAMRRNPILNHIQINNSQVGVLNTGVIERVDATITLTRGTEFEAVGDHLKLFTEALANQREIEPKDRETLAELVESLSDQINQRKRASIAATMAAILEKSSQIAALAPVAQALWLTLKPLIGG